MTKEETLQKVNDYCNEKSYTEETLTSDFKNQFVDNFIKGKEDVDIKDEKVIADIEFSLRTAFSAASKGITLKSNSFVEKENDYKRQIEELRKKTPSTNDKKEFELPEEIKEQLKELGDFKKKNELSEKRNSIAKKVKESLRPVFHSSFDSYFAKLDVAADGDSEEQAKKVLMDYQEVVKGLTGGMTPLAPDDNHGDRDKDLLESVHKVTI